MNPECGTVRLETGHVPCQCRLIADDPFAFPVYSAFRFSRSIRAYQSLMRWSLRAVNWTPEVPHQKVAEQRISPLIRPVRRPVPREPRPRHDAKVGNPADSLLPAYDG